MPAPTDPAELERIQHQYRQFATEMPAQGSPIYAAICSGLAADPGTGALALLADRAFRTPLIVLAAVHHLLLTGLRHPLASYYPSLAGDAARPIDAGLYPAFADLVRSHRERVSRLIAGRNTQTNEAGRSAATFPVLGLIQRLAGQPLALLEVGASAGLNLLPDRYGYRYGDRPAGWPGASVQLTCEVRGEMLPPLPEGSLEVGWRAGLDLNPLDVRDPETADWLRALVWPEHRDRLAILEAALAEARADAPRVVRGDLVDDLKPLAAEAPSGAALVVLSSWVLFYVEEARRRRFLERLSGAARELDRTVWLVAGESETVQVSLGVNGAMKRQRSVGDSALSLHRFHPSAAPNPELLALCHPHGRWLRWLDAATAAGPA